MRNGVFDHSMMLVGEEGSNMNDSQMVRSSAREKVRRAARPLAVAFAALGLTLGVVAPASAAASPTSWLYANWNNKPVGNCYVQGYELSYGGQAYEAGFGDNCSGSISVQARYLSAGSIVHTTSWDYDAWYAVRTHSSSYIAYGYRIGHA